MNRVFRIVWSRELNTWVVASELAACHGKGRGRSGSKAIDERSTSRVIRRAGILGAGLFAALVTLYAPQASSTDLYWDTNIGNAGNGGTGTWNTTTANWNSASDGIAGPFVAWNNGALDNALFTGTAGTVTLGTPIVAGNLTFNVGNFTLTGGTLTLAGSTPTIAANTGTTTISSVLAGNAGLVKAGGGVLRLEGTNTFTGDVNVQLGTLSVDTDAALGAAGNRVTIVAGNRTSNLTASQALSASRVVELAGTGIIDLHGGVGSARMTGTAAMYAFSGVVMSNALSDYTGKTNFVGGGTYGFTSIGMLGQASSLGAPTTVVDGEIRVDAGGGLGGTLNYSGSGDTSDRNWVFTNTSSGANSLRNIGTGTLRLSGQIRGAGTLSPSMSFQAISGDMELTGPIVSDGDRSFAYTGSSGRTITLGGANTYTGASTINGITVKAPVLANTGSTSSFGTGNGANVLGKIALVNGTLSYTGGNVSSDRNFSADGASRIDNDAADGTSALNLTGSAAFTAGGVDTLTFGGASTGANGFSGVISGAGNVVMDGSGSWTLGGANTYAGTTTVKRGTLVAGSASAFGASTGLVVDGGVLDTGGQAIVARSLAGGGGTVDIDGGSLTLNSASGSTSYSGVISGAGSLTKLGASTQTLTGSNTYTGATTVGGGTLALDFSAPGAPSSNIVSNASALVLGGGTLAIKGAGAANSQGFNGLTVSAGNNRISATAGAGGTLTLGLGGISRSGGLVDFGYNTGATITTSHADGALGGWATVNGTDYAQVAGGVITAFTNYQNKDDASQWVNGDIVSDAGGNANTPYFSTVNGNVALGGLKYTAAADSTVNVGAGNLLGIDGTIIVTSTAGTKTQQIQGGSVSGGPGGGALGVQQNSAGTFVIGSNIVDNGVPTSFTAGGSGTGEVRLGGSNTYTGATTISGSTLEIANIANGGTASALGASSSDASNWCWKAARCFTRVAWVRRIAASPSSTAVRRARSRSTVRAAT